MMIVQAVDQGDYHTYNNFHVLRMVHGTKPDNQFGNKYVQKEQEEISQYIDKIPEGSIFLAIDES